MKRVSVVSLVCLALATINVVNAAEWKIEPSLTTRVQYNDNPRLFPDDIEPDGSPVYSLNPRLALKADEFNQWDALLDMSAKLTRYQDVEDADNNNIFLALDSGTKTELTEWRLAAKLEENTNFDTDFDTKTPDAGLLLDDKTLRKTLSVTPSLQWSLSETSLINFSLNHSDVSFDEVRQTNLVDYEYDTAQFSYSTLLIENHRLGLTGSYSEFDSPENKFSYDQTVLSVDYTYTINESSNIALSVGNRSIKSLIKDVIVACEVQGQILPTIDGECPPNPFFQVNTVLEDIAQKNDGSVVNMSYSYLYEAGLFRIDGGRSVIPSSFGAAQEEISANLLFRYKSTERLSSEIKLGVSETEALSGVSLLSDRKRLQLDTGVTYRIAREMNLNLLYRYISQDITVTGQESTSNAILVNFVIRWNRLATTY